MEVDCYLKMVQSRVTPTNHVIARAGFTLFRALALWRFSHHLSAKNIRKNQTKSHYLSAGPQAGTVPLYGKSGSDY